MKQTGRLIAIFALAAGIAAAWRWRGLFDPAALLALLTDNPAAPLLFLAVHIPASLFFVPRTLLALAAGMIFGMWWGILWAEFGSVAGAVAGFLTARYIHAGFVRRADAGGLRRLAERVESGGWRAVMMVRLIPIIPHALTNYGLGLTRIGVGPYALGSLLGQLPLTIAYADLGAAGGRALAGADWRHDVLWPTLIGLAALGLSLLIPLAARLRPRRGAEPVPGA